MYTIEKHDIAVCVLLSIFTFGIYHIIWAVRLGRECVQTRDANDSGTAESLLMVFFPCVGCYLAEKKMMEGAANVGHPIADNSILYLILGIFGWSIVNFALMQNDLNQLVDAQMNQYRPY